MFFFFDNEDLEKTDLSDLTFFANFGEAQGNHHLDLSFFSRIFNDRFRTQDLSIISKFQTQLLSLDHAFDGNFLLCLLNKKMQNLRLSFYYYH